jgi:aryl-alcohol dehydrogenase-like predicted oxidoreductase
MKQRALGASGLKVSELCLGTMTFGVQCDEAASFAILDRAADAGVDFLDTADVYPIPMLLETAGRTEEILGRWLRGRRERFVVATKCFFPSGPGPNDRGASRRHVIASVEASLRRLQTDWVDLFQLHAFDAETPLEETLRALDDLVRAGKLRYVGCSNYLAWELAVALLTSARHHLVRYASVQPRYNLLHREIERELVPLCRTEGLGIVVFNPLAGGLLTGKHRADAAPAPGTRFHDSLGGSATTYRERYWRDDFFAAIEDLRRFLEPRGRRLAQVAVAWVLEQPGISAAIVGASRAEQLSETLGALDVALDAEERAFLDQLWYRLPRERPGTGPVR